MLNTPRITIAGAGSVGCYLGGCLASAGRDVTLFGRARIMDEIRERGLRIRDLDTSDRILPPGKLQVTTDPVAAFSAAGIFLVTVKCAATAGMGAIIAQHASPKAIVVSIQNGIGNAEVLHRALGSTVRVVAGMVPFNVVQTLEDSVAPCFHKGTKGNLIVASGTPGLCDLLDVPGAHVREHAVMTAVLWGKLLINLNNALNALSGIPLLKELSDRCWRLLLAAQIDEGLRTLKAAGIMPARIDGMHAREIALAMRLPDALFGIVARAMLAVDPAARSSMAEDLARRRPTEIDFLQGAILRLADEHRVPVPTIAGIIRLIKTAEAEGRGSPALTPDGVRNSLGTP